MKKLRFAAVILAMTMTACTADKDDHTLIIDLAECYAKLSVLNVSGQSDFPAKIQIDGLYDNKKDILMGTASQPTTYEVINPGMRHLVLGNYKDSVHLEANNYYTLMVYDRDSVLLMPDAPFSAAEFDSMPQVRWNMTGANASDYQVNITSDSTLRNIAMGKFVSVSDKKELKLSLFPRENVDIMLDEATFTTNVGLNKKLTVNIVVDEKNNKYHFSTIEQKTK